MIEKAKTLIEKLKALVEKYGYETSYVKNMFWAIKQPDAMIGDDYVMLVNKDVSLIHKEGYKIMNQTIT